jgi:hypothetical protein
MIAEASMTRPPLGILTATAALTLFGGLDLEIASGRALDRFTPDDARLQSRTALVATAVNREMKGDRSMVSPNTTEGRTIVFQHPDLQSTTVALHLRESVSAARNRPPSKEKKAPAEKAKQAIACEGVVSALTDVAKQLDAGRCVT